MYTAITNISQATSSTFVAGSDPSRRGGFCGGVKTIWAHLILGVPAASLGALPCAVPPEPLQPTSAAGTGEERGG